MSIFFKRPQVEILKSRMHASQKYNSRALALYYPRALPFGLLVLFFCAVVIALALYGYYLNKAVEYASLRASSEEDRARLSGVVAALESERATLVGGLTLERAREVGLLEVSHPIFLTRGAEKTLSLAAGNEGL